MHARLGLNNTQTSLQHTCSLPYSDDKESLEYGVDNVRIARKTGIPMHTPQAITHLETKSLTGKFMSICSQTLD